MATLAETPGKTAPALKCRFYSHATLECRDIPRTRQFYEEFLGFETVQMGSASFWARMGGQQIIAVVKGWTKEMPEMNFLNHNGLDVANETEVDEAYEAVLRDAEKWNLTKISKPTVQHGTYAFYFWDMDGNAWEICTNPEGGFAWGFERGDQKGTGHMSTKFERPAETLTKER